MKNRRYLAPMVLLLFAFVLRNYLYSGEALTGNDGACWKGTSRHEMERLKNLQSRYKPEEFLEGPGLEAASSASDNRVACKFVLDERTAHFPHAMQQFYRCISWFFANEDKEPFIILDKRYPITTPFIQGIIEIMRDAMKVKIVRFRVDLQVVRGTQTYDWDEQHSFAMRGPEDAKKFQKIALDHFNIPETNASSCRAPRIGILNRKGTRVLRNVGRLVTMLEHKLENSETAPDARVRVMTFEEQPFDRQLEFLSTTDILVSPHGAQLSGLPFLPHCAQVLEVFPLGYLTPAFFGSLAAVSGVEHAYLYLGSHSLQNLSAQKAELKKHMASLETREAARAANLCPDPEVMVRAVQQLLGQWQRCCWAGR